MKKAIIYIQVFIEKLGYKIAEIKFDYKNGCYKIKRWCK